jgi:hypothetical protein
MEKTVAAHEQPIPSGSIHIELLGRAVIIAKSKDNPAFVRSILET